MYLKNLFVAAAALFSIAEGSNQAWAGNLYTGQGFQNGGLEVSLSGFNGGNGSGNAYFEAGGSIGVDSPGNYDGVQLPFLYCVDIPTPINVPGNYQTLVTSDGYVHGGLIANAGQIAWLIDNIAPYAASHDTQLGLQAAIWQQVYGSAFKVEAGTSNEILAAYNADITGLGTNTASVSDVAWLSPYNGEAQQSSNAQGLITAGNVIHSNPSHTEVVPEPSTLVLLGLGGFGLAIDLIRRRRRSMAMNL